jgi:hypothetical protein
VALASSGLQGVASLSFSPASVNLSNGNTLTVTGTISALAAAPIGTYSVLFAGSSGPLSHTGSVPLSVQGGSSGGAPTYSAAAVPPSILMTSGQNGSFNLIVAGSSGFSGPVIAAITSVTSPPFGPTCLTASFANGQQSQSVTLSGSGTQSLTVNLACSNLPSWWSWTVSISFSGGGIQKTITVPVVVNPYPPLSVSLTYALSNSTPQVVTLTPVVQNASGSVTYRWFSSFGWSSTQLTFPYTYTLPVGPSSVFVAAIDVHGIAYSNTLNLVGIAPLTISAGGPYTASAGVPITISTTSGGGSPPYTYAWTGATATTAGQASFTHSTAGSFPVSVTITDSAGATATANTTVNVIAGLTLTLSGNKPTTAGASIQLTATAAGGTTPYTYTWTGASMNASPNNNTATFVQSQAGDYNVSVTVSDGIHPSPPAATVTVHVSAPLTVTEAGPGSVQTGQSITLTALGAGGIPFAGSSTPYTYAWTGATPTIPGAATATFMAGSTVPSPNPVTVSVQVTDSTGTSAMISTQVTVTTLPVPIITITPSGPATTSNSIVLTANVANPTGAYTYQWIATGGTLSNSNQQAATFSSLLAGPYSLTVTATDTNGASGSQAFSVTVAGACVKEFIRLGGHVIAAENSCPAQ